MALNEQTDTTARHSGRRSKPRDTQSSLGLVIALVVIAALVLLAVLTARDGPLGAAGTGQEGAQDAADQFRRAIGGAAQILPASPNDLGTILFRLLLAASLGAAISFRGTRKRNEFQIVHTNMIIAFAGAMTMIIIGSDLARAFGLVGASSIVRYRTPVRDPKALAALFVSMAAGIAVGVGLYELAIIGAILVIVLETLLERGGFALSRGWYRPEQSYELSIETDTPDITLKAVREIFEAQGIAHMLMDYDRGKKGENVKLGLIIGLPERADAEELTLQVLEAGARSVSWRQTRD